MSTGSAVHKDVASYALGVLDERDAERFEEHLAHCTPCIAELESFLPVTDLMREVDADSLISMEETVREGRMLGDVVSLVAYERSRARSRRTLALAAASIVSLILLGVGVAVGNSLYGSTPSRQATHVTPGTLSGNGGPDGTETGTVERKATDPVTKAQATVLVDSLEWGTRLDMQLAGVKGPLTCQLVVVGQDGTGEVVSSWSVPNAGYGTKEHPEPLQLQASTALRRSKIDHYEVQTVDKDGRTGLLVSIPA